MRALPLPGCLGGVTNNHHPTHTHTRTLAHTQVEAADSKTTRSSINSSLLPAAICNLAGDHAYSTNTKQNAFIVRAWWTEPRNPVKGVRLRGALCISWPRSELGGALLVLSYQFFLSVEKHKSCSVCYSSYLINHKSIIPTSSRMTFNCNIKFSQVLLQFARRGTPPSAPRSSNFRSSPEDLELGILGLWSWRVRNFWAVELRN